MLSINGLIILISLGGSLVLVLMSVFFILKGVAQYFNGWYRVVIQQYFIKDLRIENINSLSQVNFKTFLKEDGGRIQNTLSGEVDKVAKAYQGYFQSFQFATLPKYAVPIDPSWSGATRFI